MTDRKEARRIVKRKRKKTGKGEVQRKAGLIIIKYIIFNCKIPLYIKFNYRAYLAYLKFLKNTFCF